MQTGDTNDYSLCTTWRIEQNIFYLLDVFRARPKYPDLRRKVIALAQERRPATILIEDAWPGMNLLQDLRASMPTGLICPIPFDGVAVARIDIGAGPPLRQARRGPPAHREPR
jgi:phage terminase large subunit-like protein